MSNEPKEKQCALYVRPVPVEAKNFFKAECARRNITMQEALIMFMADAARMIPLLKQQRYSRIPKPQGIDSATLPQG